MTPPHTPADAPPHNDPAAAPPNDPAAALTRALSRCHLTGAAWTDDPTQPTQPATVVVMALSAGPAFTEAALRHAPSSPDPVDDFARHAITRHLLPALNGLGRVLRWAAPTGEAYDATGAASPRVNFSKLARRAALGDPSRLGILLNPTYGLWWAMRFAAWVEVRALARPALEASPLWRTDTHLSDAHPPDDLASACATCPAPCLRACPALRLPWPLATLPHPTLPLHACIEHLLSGGCQDACAARSACPQGQGWAYSDAAHGHHHRAFRRMASGDG